jgi:nucleoside-triphosphatase THEP1
MIMILTGEKGCGKTSLINDLLLRYKIRVQGFLSLKEVHDKEVTGISLLILPERKMFPMATTSPIITTEKTSSFYFYPKAFALVNRHFHHITKDLPFIFDEFGFLEMHQKGHFPVFERLIKAKHKTLVVVRKTLANEFASSFCSGITYSVMDMKKHTQKNLQKDILGFLKGDVIL